MNKFDYNKLYLIDGKILERVVETIALLLKENNVYEKPMKALLKILLTLEEIYDMHEFDDEFDNIDANKIMNDIFNIDSEMPFEDNEGVNLKQLLKEADIFIPEGRK